jgi:micrococcal nuclease
VRALLALAACGGDPCGPSTGVVDRVIDGDTIVLATGVKIRYLLIDAPETTDGRDDCYGQNAAQFNRDRVSGKTVELTYDQVCRDDYGRTLAYVAADGDDINSLMIQRGYACLLHIPPDGDDRADAFAEYQREAKAEKRGLWGACDPIPCN